jgi:hypothetical protein
MNIGYRILAVLIVTTAAKAWAIEDSIELETTRIITNEELPGILYLIPWKDVEATRVGKQKLVLHEFFGDLYEPIAPALSGPEDSGAN